MMKPAILATLALAAASALHAATPLTFDDALARLAGRHAPVTASVVDTRVLPTVRLETTAGASRTEELFFQTPFALQSATAVVRFEYPIFGARDRRLLSRIARNDDDALRAASSVSDEEYAAFTEAFASLASANAQLAQLSAAARDAEALAARGPALVESGSATVIAAATWEDASLSLQSRILDLQMRKVAAAARLRELLGTTDEIVPVVDVERSMGTGDRAAALRADATVLEAARALERTRLALEQAVMRGRPTATIDGLGGLGAALSRFQGEESSGTFAVYSLRVHLSFPLFNASGADDVARARREVERAEANLQSVTARVTRELEATATNAAVLEQRIALLEKSVAVSNRRVEAVQRLVNAGARPEGDVVYANVEAAIRRAQVEEARLDLWKTRQQLGRRALPGRR